MLQTLSNNIREWFRIPESLTKKTKSTFAGIVEMH